MDQVEQLCSLVREVRNGHPERLEELLRASVGLVHALARARLGDTIRAEEAAADALARAARSLPTLRDPDKYARWLARIVSHSVAEAAGSAASRATVPIEERVDPSSGPEELARARERALRIRQAVAALPGRIREPLMLHFAESLSYREIAAVLGLGLGTVSRRVGKGLRTLGLMLGEEP